MPSPFFCVRSFCQSGENFIAQVEEYVGSEVEISKKVTSHGWQVVFRMERKLTLEETASMVKLTG